MTAQRIPAGGWRRHFAELNRRRSNELRTEARTLTGNALRGAMRDAMWHAQEARRLEADPFTEPRGPNR